MYKKSRKKYS